MEDDLSMADIDTIVSLLKDNNKQLEAMNDKLGALHNDFEKLKGEVNKSLAETNGKLKGNHELLTQKIESMIESSNLHDEILENKITNNADDITILKGSLKDVESNKVKINILFGASGAMALAIVIELISRFK